MLQGTHTRETRDGARELKFLVRAETAAEVLAWARPRLSPDPHAGGPSGDEYVTTTIYLDTHDQAVFHRRGSYGRSKYRIRRYGTSEIAFLERKLRTGRLLNKRRTTVSTGQLEALFDFSANGGVSRWFLDRVAHRRLAPVCQVSYCRHALVGSTEDGPFRLTFDDDIRVQPNTTTTFVPDGGLPVLEGRVIIEMKYCAEMPEVLGALVEEFALVPEAISKYRLSVGELATRRPSAPVEDLLEVEVQGTTDGQSSMTDATGA